MVDLQNALNLFFVQNKSVFHEFSLIDRKVDQILLFSSWSEMFWFPIDRNKSGLFMDQTYPSAGFHARTFFFSL